MTTNELQSEKGWRCRTDPGIDGVLAPDLTRVYEAVLDRLGDQRVTHVRSKDIEAQLPDGRSKIGRALSGLCDAESCPLSIERWNNPSDRGGTVFRVERAEEGEPQ